MPQPPFCFPFLFCVYLKVTSFRQGWLFDPERRLPQRRLDVPQGRQQRAPAEQPVPKHFQRLRPRRLRLRRLRHRRQWLPGKASRDSDDPNNSNSTLTHPATANSHNNTNSSDPKNLRNFDCRSSSFHGHKSEMFFFMSFFLLLILSCYFPTGFADRRPDRQPPYQRNQRLHPTGLETARALRRPRALQRRHCRAVLGLQNLARGWVCEHRGTRP